MDHIRDVVSAAHALRKAEKLRVRLPLSRLTVVAPDPHALAPFADLVASEVNVKSVEVIGVAQSGLQSSQELSLNPKAFDPAVRKLTSQLFQAQKSGAWEVNEDGSEVVLPGVLLDGAPVRLRAAQFSLSTKVQAAPGTAADVIRGGIFVVLDTEVTEELEAEGYARDVIRAVQDTRKAEGLDVADRIDLRLEVPENFLPWVVQHRELIASETLSLTVEITGGAAQLQVGVKKHA